MNTALKSSRCRAGGFTLTELMAVIAIVVILTGAATPVVSFFSGRQRYLDATTTFSIAFQQAQQQAITRDTYTWVAFDNLSSGSLAIATLISQTGVPPTSSGLDTTAANATVRLLAPPVVISGVNVQASAPNAGSFTHLPVTQTAPSSPQSSNIPVTVQLIGVPGSSTLNWVVQFNPRGEATVVPKSGSGAGLGEATPPSPVEAINVAVVPGAAGTSSAAQNAQSSILWINGLSGKTDLYQP